MILKRNLILATKSFKNVSIILDWCQFLKIQLPKLRWSLGKTLLFSTQNVAFHLCAHFQIFVSKKTFYRSQVHLVWMRADGYALGTYVFFVTRFEWETSIKIAFTVWGGEPKKPENFI